MVIVLLVVALAVAVALLVVAVALLVVAVALLVVAVAGVAGPYMPQAGSQLLRHCQYVDLQWPELSLR